MFHSVLIYAKAGALSFILGLSMLPLFSQNLRKINLEEIPQRKVRNYIVSKKIDRMKNFSSIRTSWKRGTNKSDFKVNEKVFYLKDKLANVWEHYWHADPLKIWNGRSLQLGLLILKSQDSAIYINNSSFHVIDTGQVYFLNLKLIKGIFNVPVAFEIINIDTKLDLLEISYIDNNKSRGKQTIQFFASEDGGTRIVHRSYFKSNSWIRDDILYPYFHLKFVKEFHRKMRQQIYNARIKDTIPKEPALISQGRLFPLIDSNLTQ